VAAHDRKARFCQPAGCGTCLPAARRQHFQQTHRAAASLFILRACGRQAAVDRRLRPHGDVESITPEVVCGLGIDRQTLDSEMMRDYTKRRKRPSRKAVFRRRRVLDAGPAVYRSGQTARNRSGPERGAAAMAASAEERSRQRALLLQASPDIYREVFGVAPGEATADSSSLAESPATVSRLSEIVRRNQYRTERGEEHFVVTNVPLRFCEPGRSLCWRWARTAGTRCGCGATISSRELSWESIRLRPLTFMIPAALPYDPGRSGQCRAARALAISANPAGFHIIIDAASHLGEWSATAFKTLFYDLLLPGGFYAIESWGTGYWDSWPDGGRPGLTIEPDFPTPASASPATTWHGRIRQTTDR